MPSDGVLVRAEHVRKEFPIAKGWFGRGALVAVNDVDLSINRGEIVALVGESGSGKSTLGRILAQLTKASSGSVWFDGADMSEMHGSMLRRYRKRVGVVFQNPYGSLNPRLPIGAALAEPLRVWNVVPAREVHREVERLLGNVGLPTKYVSRYPHALSGGERQRVALARALAVRPEFLFADEIVSSLDVSTAAEIINLLLDLHAGLGLAVLFATHDLSAARVVADRIVVMHQGSIVESGVPATLFDNPKHPYTQRLLSSQLRLEV